MYIANTFQIIDMKYRILAVDLHAMERSLTYASTYVESGLTEEERQHIDSTYIDGWEDALNHICSTLNFKLISVYLGNDKNGSIKLMHVFEELSSNESISM